MSGLKDKVALITGASSGIGYTTAVMMSSRGALLAVTGRNEASLEKLRAECSAANPNAAVLVIVGDVTKEADVERIVETVIDHYKRLDILVNNAGVIEKGSIENTSLDQYDRVMGINVRSVYHLSMLCTPHLIKTEGCVVNLSSVAGLKSFPGVLSYCMSKSAIDQMTRCMAVELGSKQVRVNAVNPGVIVTDLHKRGGMSEEEYAAFLENSKKSHALGRPGTTEEVAEAICFLADKTASGFMTGNTIPVDGGRHALCPR